METFLMYTTITVIMAPLLLVYGIPFIAAAFLFHRATPLWLSARARLVGASAISALGIAPGYDAYMAPTPVYVRLLEGYAVPAGAAVISFAVTWLVVYLKAHALAGRRARQYA
ncbi:MAG TPA: hypothetical protein VLT89_00530 [Usitatibacter sp.]|nr:hypothetical protein [Usitatibacter sp.]